MTEKILRIRHLQAFLLLFYQSISSIPVIILSNLGQKEDIEKGMKLGAANYFIKAYLTPGEIIEKVKAALK